MALGVYQFIIACYYLGAVWRRTLYSAANAYEDFSYRCSRSRHKMPLVARARASFG